jgi:WD40 repeat protein
MARGRAPALTPEDASMLGLVTTIVCLLSPIALSMPVEHGRESVLSFGASAPSPDGATIAVGCSDGTVRLVDVETRRQVRVLAEHESEVRWIAWSGDGALLAVADAGGRVVPFDLAAGGCFPDFQVEAMGGEASVRRQRLFEFQPGGDLLLVRLCPWMGTVVWNVREGFSVPLGDVPGKEVDHADWAADGSLLVCRGPEGVVVLDRELGSVRSWSAEPAARVGAIAPDGERVVTSSGDGVDVVFRRTESMAETLRTRVEVGSVVASFGDTVTALRFSADGSLVVGATSTWASFTCWDAQTGEVLWAREFGGNPVFNDARFVLGDRWVMTRGKVRVLLDARTGEDVPVRRPIGASPEGGFVLAQRRLDTLEILDAETLEPRFAFVPLADGAWWAGEPAR